MSTTSLSEFLKACESEFRKANAGGLNPVAELRYVNQIIAANDYLGKVARSQQDSLRDAVMNLASIGVTLSPPEGLAFIVPRDGRVRYELSYRGMIKLAIDCGAIVWAKAELVYEGDTFRWRGFDQAPVHEFDPFSDRMDLSDPFKGLRGGYCQAKLSDGSFLLDRMTAAEIMKVRDTSKAGKGPWLAQYKDSRGQVHKGWPEEMIKKTLVKRAYKSWPAAGPRMAAAIEVDNDAYGIETAEQDRPLSDERAAHLERIEALLKAKGKTADEVCKIAGVQQVRDLADSRLPRLINWLEQQEDVQQEEAA